MSEPAAPPASASGGAAEPVPMGRPLPRQGRPEDGLLYHTRRGGHLVQVIVRGGVWAWRCDALGVCVTEHVGRGRDDFLAWMKEVPA